jgi:hypothetical protein
MMGGMSEGAPKSAFELAMERLQKKDAEDGTSALPLTEAQRTAIADVRRFYDASLAQEDVLHQSKLRGVIDPETREELDRQYRRERERLTAERDRKIEQIRRVES